MPESSSADRGLEGLRVLSLESRRAEQMAKLIENYGGVAISAPSMREVPIEENAAALSFAERLFAGEFEAVIFLTGVGTRVLFAAVETKHPRAGLVEALSRVLVVARGPKPVAALREFGVPIAIAVPEPNTWRDILKTLDEHRPAPALRGMRVAVQEYGA
ncbi:MAG TPA: uroporphyrinogen-III synthase, partial [Terriglobia bacterium]